MIKYKSIPVNESDALNKFVEMHEPLTSKENNDSGITLHNGFFIIRFEDGKFNDKAVGLSNCRQALNTYKNNIVIKEITAMAAENELRHMFPKDEWRDENGNAKSRNFFEEYYKAKGLNTKNSTELADKVIKSIQDKLLAEFEVKRTREVNIPILESIMESFK